MLGSAFAAKMKAFAFSLPGDKRHQHQNITCRRSLSRERGYHLRVNHEASKYTEKCNVSYGIAPVQQSYQNLVEAYSDVSVLCTSCITRSAYKRGYLLRVNHMKLVSMQKIDKVSHDISPLSECGGAADSDVSAICTSGIRSESFWCYFQIKEMDYVKGGLGWKVWGTALILSWRLVSLQRSFHNKHVLELGSGCGLCGLLAAKLGACEVVLTDYVPDILSNLCENSLLLPATILELKELGQSGLQMGPFDFAYEGEDAGLFSKESGPMIRVRMLDWAEDAICSAGNKESSHHVIPKLSADEQFDWVIGSDLIYNQYNTKSLVGVVKRRLLKGGRALFAAPVRDSKELNLFLSELDINGMDAHVECCSQQEWEACMTLLEVEEGGTLHGVDHYEGGLVIIHVKHKV